MKWFFRSIFFAAALSTLVPLSGCKKSTEQLGSATQTFTIKGTVVAVDTQRGEVTLQHDAIPGFMEAMTMPYKVERPEIAKEFQPGDVIRARLLTEKDSDGVYHNTRLNEIAILAQKHLNVKPTANYHVPTKGDAIPDFDMTNQDGKPLHFSQLKGKAVLLTFIYTRCPLGDYCPKMSRNFQAIRGMMKNDAAVQNHTEFVSISFDPTFDTPAVLKAYGKNYVGGDDFSHWQFVRPKDDTTLKAIEQFFNVGATQESNGSLTHSLSTVLIDPQGKIADWFPGNEWDPATVYAQMKALAQK
ncbi:MAG: SCO family protein [Terriglobus sp.]